MLHDNDIALEIMGVSHCIRREVEKSKSKLNIKGSKGIHGWAIDYFYQNRDKDVFQKDFENSFSIRSSTATKILQSMESNGFIVRIPVQSDARLKKIVLTEKALSIHTYIEEDISKREIKLRKNVSEKDLKVFFKCMKQFKENLEVDNG